MAPAAPLPAAGAVVAVKDLSRAKSRMIGLPAPLRGRVATLMAVAVARAWSEVVESVVVVTTAPGIGPLLSAHGVRARVVPDPRAGLNAAFEAGERALRPAGCDLVVASMADLPALTAGALREALASCTESGRWFVRDAPGTGTTVLAARGEQLTPLFGPGSAARHHASGAVELAAPEELRVDADEPADLLRAVEFGIADPLAALLDGGTLGAHDTATVIGPSDDGWAVVTAAGSQAHAPRRAVGPELRRLAPGQRVHLVRAAEGTVLDLWI
ncbi:MAG: 2-phospho-L-lactate guanylyltransferase [Propionibacteriaceae bacterium]|nr:2-phospho-L-lactate guanylyltransferase [Propionibacteriaceae bacterium]